MEFYENYADCTRVPAATMDKMVRASPCGGPGRSGTGDRLHDDSLLGRIQREMQISVCSLVSEA